MAGRQLLSVSGRVVSATRFLTVDLAMSQSPHRRQGMRCSAFLRLQRKEPWVLCQSPSAPMELILWFLISSTSTFLIPSLKALNHCTGWRLEGQRFLFGDGHLQTSPLLGANLPSWTSPTKLTLPSPLLPLMDNGTPPRPCTLCRQNCTQDSTWSR